MNEDKHVCGEVDRRTTSNWECYEEKDGRLRLSVNYEYGVQVNFCPFCGYKSKDIKTDI